MGAEMTGDAELLLTLLARYVSITRKPFQFVMGDVHERIYNEFGKLEDPDQDEIGNDEYIIVLRELIRDREATR